MRSRGVIVFVAGIGVMAIFFVAWVAFPSPQSVPASGGIPASSPTGSTVPPPSNGGALPVPAVTPPVTSALRFVNIGDWGNSQAIDPQVFRQLERTHAAMGFTDIVTNGDNNYGSAGSLAAYVEEELGKLLAAGVKLHFSLGNHDVDAEAKWQDQVGNPVWGEWDCSECRRVRPAAASSRYYSFYRAPVRFVMLDSNLMLDGDTGQFGWAAQEVSASVAAGEPWQVLVFHHPPFSAAQTHGGARALVDRYKGVLKALGVDVVFNGHDHTYERIKTTAACGDGVQYVVNGAVRIRRDDIKQPNACTAAYWDDSPLFVAVEATPTRFHARAITDTGKVVDEWEMTQP